MPPRRPTRVRCWPACCYAIDAGTLTLAASDGFRLAVRTLTFADTTAHAAWIVPARALIEVAHSLSPAPGLPVIVSQPNGAQALHFALGDIDVTTRLIEGQFPD